MFLPPEVTMARKMAVRNKDDKNSNEIFLLPKISAPINPAIKGTFRAVLIVSFVAVCVFAFQLTKRAVVEQWKVTEISINSNLNQIEPESIAKILEKDEYAYLLQTDIVELRNEIRQLDWVKQVEIRKSWPNTIEILIEEYIPLAQINSSILIDSGKLVKANNNENMDDLPKLIFQKKNELIKYLEIFGQYQKMQAELISIGIKIKSLSINENYAWTLNASNDLEIKIGRKKQVIRVERLIATFRFIENIEEVKTIDLRYNNGFAVSRKPLLNELAG